MKKNYYLTFFILFLFSLSFGQAPPLPPTPEEIQNYNTGKTKIIVKPVEVSQTERNNNTENEEVQNIVPQFKISLSESTDKNSIYYFRNIETQIAKLDTLVSAEQIISLTKYKIHTNIINPSYLDSLAGKAYKFNEDKHYSEAVEVAKKILIQSPNNITAHKELSYAYKRLGEKNLSDLHFSMMVKIIKSVLKYGEGSRKNPYILNNFFEGLSIYEAKFDCFPRKVRLILTTEKKLLGGYDCFHIMRFSDMTHWLPSLSAEDYKIEQ